MNGLSLSACRTTGRVLTFIDLNSFPVMVMVRVKPHCPLVPATDFYFFHLYRKTFSTTSASRSSTISRATSEAGTSSRRARPARFSSTPTSRKVRLRFSTAVRQSLTPNL